MLSIASWACPWMATAEAEKLPARTFKTKRKRATSRSARALLISLATTSNRKMSWLLCFDVVLFASIVVASQPRSIVWDYRNGTVKHARRSTTWTRYAYFSGASVSTRLMALFD